MRWSRGIVGVAAALLLFGGTACSGDDDGNGGNGDDNMNGQMDASMDVPDGEPMCEPTAIPCCNESGQQITLAQCTFEGLKCPAGLTEANCYDGGLPTDGEGDVGTGDADAAGDAGDATGDADMPDADGTSDGNSGGSG